LIAVNLSYYSSAAAAASPGAKPHRARQGYAGGTPWYNGRDTYTIK